MKTKDLLTICLQNLTRHKSRTFLTVLGVIIGCCSVVIMISIGIGMKEAQKNMLAQMGDLTIINVYSAGKGSRSAKLNNQAIRRLKEMKSVEAVTPKLTAENIPITLYAGRNRRYKSAYTTIVGIDVKAAEAMVSLWGRILPICLRTPRGLPAETRLICTADMITWMKVECL